ncbi:hypothetical protein OIU84_015774 [Salix udensis]|uniref:Uncharacterized protein n=1 Tax=Salix udensis TaxID=889485 RepID=A0AAD6NPM7_9ROSI|nr:hypothetical protein OIU84_015774 [Salix udensis]
MINDTVFSFLRVQRLLVHSLSSGFMVTQPINKDTVIHFLIMFETMESSVNGGGVGGGFSHLQSCGDSSEEELSVLPRHTKVVVTGNNRTKSVLVGLQGVVKKAVGLGGWHWLVNVSIFFRFWVLRIQAKWVF